MSAVIDFLGIGLIGPFIAMITYPDRLLNRYAWIKNLVGDYTHNEILIGIGVGLICIFITKGIAYYFVQRRLLRLTYDCRTELVSQLLNIYQRMPYHLHLSRNSAQLIVNINTHTGLFVDGVVLQILRSSVEAFVLIALFILLAWTNIWAMLIITIYFTTIICVWDRMHKRRLVEYGSIISRSEAGIITSINHAIGALKEVRLLGRESYFQAEVVKNAKQMAVAGTKSRVLQGLQRYVFEVSLVAFVVGTIFVTMATKGGDVASALVFLGIFGVAAIRILPSISQIAFSFSAVRSYLYAVDMLYKDLSELNEYA